MLNSEDVDSVTCKEHWHKQTKLKRNILNISCNMFFNVSQ